MFHEKQINGVCNFNIYFTSGYSSNEDLQGDESSGEEKRGGILGFGWLTSVHRAEEYIK